MFGRQTERLPRISTAHERARRHWKRAKLAPIGLHECRHSFASLMLASGCDWLALARIMGHSQASTSVQLYGHLLPDAEQRAADALDAFLVEQAAER